MNVETMTMDPELARERLRSVRSQLHRRADDEYKALEQGYQALAEGTPLINIAEVIRAGGFDEKMRPRLAIARADRRQVKLTWRAGQTLAEFDSGFELSGGQKTPSMVVAVDLDRTWDDPTRWRPLEGYSLVPMIPPQVRESSGVAAYRDRAHFILWEVEAWADRPRRAVPDRDPFLLRHLGGDLYAVLAEWDLTPLERAVMAGRRQG
jgi:hypothetical protein